MPGPIQAITAVGRFCSAVISTPLAPFVYGLAGYAGMEVYSLIAATIQMSKAFDQVTSEWVTRENFWGNATKNITASFCCRISNAESTTPADNCNDGPINYFNMPHGSFKLADRVLNNRFFSNATPTAAYGGFTSVIPVIFGTLFLVMVLSNPANRYREIRYLESFCYKLLEMLVAFIALLPYLFVVFDLGAFNTLSGAVWATSQLCELPADSLETVSNPYNSSALFVTEYYDGNDSQKLFLPVMLLHASVMVVAYFSAHFYNNREAYLNRGIGPQRRGIVDRGENRPLLQREVTVDPEEVRPLQVQGAAALAFGDEGCVTVPVVPVKKSLSYQEKVDFIDKKAPEFFLEVRTTHHYLFCPITLSPMIDPVMASDGNVYERNILIAYLKNAIRSPLTTEPFTESILDVQKQPAVAPFRSAVLEIIDRKYHSLCQTEEKRAVVPTVAAASEAAQARSDGYENLDDAAASDHVTLRM